MKLADIKNVLSFAAFRPEPDDGSATWTRRFPNTKTLLLNVGKNRTTWRCIGKGGRMLDGGTQKGDFKDITSSLAPEWRKLTDDGWCNISINSRYVISLESNLPRKEGSEDSIRTNARAALGSKFERTKRYALTNNPEHATSIVLACEEEVIKKIESALMEGGLHAGRICCGTYTLLRRAIEHVNDGGHAGKEPPQNLIYVICCDGSVCILAQTGDVWSELRSRSDFYDDDTAPVLEMVTSSRLTGENQTAEIIFSADHSGSDLPDKLLAEFPGMKITDLTKSDHLWSLMADLS